MAQEPQKKKRVGKEDTVKFIKTPKRSEYSTAEQLKKQPAQISILSLSLSSKAHQDELLKMNESQVPEGIATKDLEQ